MRTRKRPQSIGLSMLDLISNSLASVIILFIILSSLRTPQVPPETFLGTVFIRYEANFVGHQKPDSLPKIALWIKPNTHNGIYNDLLRDENGAPSFIWNQQMVGLNNTIIEYQNSDTASDELVHADPDLKIVRAAIYSRVDSSNICYLILRNPPAGTYENGLLFTDNLELNKGSTSIMVRRTVEITPHGKDTQRNVKDTTIESPTGYWNCDILKIPFDKSIKKE
jgi:hypothetical protein